MADKKDNDYSYFERDKDGHPVKFVQHHESHEHKGKKPHEHEVDLRDVNIKSIQKHGDFSKHRKDRD